MTGYYNEWSNEKRLMCKKETAVYIDAVVSSLCAIGRENLLKLLKGKYVNFSIP